MDSFSSIILLALLTWGQATPFTTVTQIPRTDHDVSSETVTDEFIEEQQLLTSSPAPQNMTTTQGRSTTAGGEEGSAMVEEGEPMIFQLTTAESTTTEHTTPEPTTTEHTTPEPTTPELIAPEPTTSEPTTSEPTNTLSASTILLNEQNDMPIEDTTTAEPSESKQTEMTTRANVLSTMSDLGSGVEESSSADPTVFLSLDGSGATEEPLTTTMKMPKRGRALAVPINKPMPQENVTKMPKGHVTPDWIIITGFLVGLAVLVLICVAIATREKWNGPNQYNNTGVTITPVDQQSEVEMEEFLHKRHPRDNGKTDDYTVIPLDELPDTYSS